MTDETDDLRIAMREAQLTADDQHDQAKQIVESARPTPEELHKTMLGNMTTKPEISNSFISLLWMQHRPERWDGSHPEYCEDLARFLGIGSEI